MTPREQRLVGVAATLLVGYLGYTYAYVPLTETRVQTRDRIEEAHFQLAKARTTLRKATDVEMRVRALERQRTRLTGKLLPGGSEGIAGSELTNLVNNVSSRVGVELENSKIGSSSIQGDLTLIPIEIRLKVTIDQLLDLLFQLENHQKELTLSDVTIRTPNATKPDGKLDLRITVSGFWRSPNGGAST